MLLWVSLLYSHGLFDLKLSLELVNSWLQRPEDLQQKLYNYYTHLNIAHTHTHIVSWYTVFGKVGGGLSQEWNCQFTISELNTIFSYIISSKVLFFGWRIPPSVKCDNIWFQFTSHMNGNHLQNLSGKLTKSRVNPFKVFWSTLLGSLNFVPHRALCWLNTEIGPGTICK